MDPNANLAEQERIEGRRDGSGRLNLDDHIRLNELRAALRDWLVGGGFAPDWAKYPAARASFARWSDRPLVSMNGGGRPARYEVRPQGPRTWGVYRVSDGAVVEGGFFDRAFAVRCAADWEAQS